MRHRWNTMTATNASTITMIAAARATVKMRDVSIGFDSFKFRLQKYKPPARPMSHWRKNMSQNWKNSFSPH
jgi:hypothetical protein